MWDLKQWHKRTYLQNRNRLSGIENKHGYPRDGGYVWNLRLTYTHYCIKQRRRKWQPAPGSCLGNPVDRGYSPRGHKRVGHDLQLNNKNMRGFGTPGGASGKEPASRQCGRRKRHRFSPWVGKVPWRRKWQPAPVFSLENFMDWGTWGITVHGVTESRLDWSDWALT